MDGLCEAENIHELTKTIQDPKRYKKSHFYRFMIDNGCAGGSSGGVEKYMEYLKHIW